MSKTDVHANYFMHQQAQNQNGQIFAGYLIDKAIQCAYLSVHEIVQLSLGDKKMTAE
jgi:hypothetical protein